MDKTWMEIAKGIVERPATLVLVLGIVILLLGLAGGVTFNSFHLPIAPGWQQVTGVLVGAAMIIYSLIALFSDGPDGRYYGIRILSPTNNTLVNITTQVTGSIRRALPTKYELWLVRIFGDGSFLPVRQVFLARNSKTWSVANIGMGSAKSGETRILAVFLIDPAAQELFRYFDAAAQRHNKWMDDLKVGVEVRDRYLPNLTQETIKKCKILECDRIEVVKG